MPGNGKRANKIVLCLLVADVMDFSMGTWATILVLTAVRSRGISRAVRRFSKSEKGSGRFLPVPLFCTFPVAVSSFLHLRVLPRV